MRPAQVPDGGRPWGCLIAAGLASLLGLSVLGAALVLLVLPTGLRQRTALSASGTAGPGLIGGSANGSAEPATMRPTAPAATATRTATPSATSTRPSPTATRTPQPPPPTPDTDGPPAPTILGPMNNLRIDCTIPLSVSLSWEAPSDPSGIDSYRVRLAKFGADFTEEQLFDGLPAGQVELTIQAECGTSYGWEVLARDGAGNGGVESPRAYFVVDSATSAPTSLSPANYKHLSCVAQIILRWEAPEDPDGIFGYQVDLQTVFGAGYGELQTFGWMVSTHYDATQRTDCNNTYRWRVLASDLQMNEGLQSEWAYFIIDLPGQ